MQGIVDKLNFDKEKLENDLKTAYEIILQNKRESQDFEN